MDRLDAMGTFVAVADAGGFAAAARRLGRSPAAVTRTLAALEADLGTQLFRRTTRVVTLTSAGSRFLVDARRVLADVEESTAKVRGADATLHGTLVVTASVMFGNRYVSPILLAFLATHPAIQVRALLVDRVVDLVAEGVDVAVRIAHLRDSSLKAIRVGAVRRVLCASPRYLDERGAPRAPRDLARHDVVAFSSGAPPRDFSFAHRRRTYRVPIAPRLVTNATETSIAAAVAGYGIVRALSYQVAAEVESGALVVVLERYEPPPLPIHVVHGSGGAAPLRVRAFVDRAVADLRSDRRLDPARFGKKSRR